MSADTNERRVRAASFGGVADVYERSRPGYPEDAVRWLAGEEPCDVVDLGAGTGKLTRSLVDLGHRVTAVEPLPEMLDQLRVAVPEATAVEGGAEAIPLPAESADVVTVAQAFHWFDHGPALVEIARVLRPGGRIALVWNVRDESEPYGGRAERCDGGEDGRRHGCRSTPIDASGLFGPVERATFSHVQEVDRETLQELVRSRSYCAVLSEEERAPVLQNVDDLFTEHARDGVAGPAVPDRVLPRDPAVSAVGPYRSCPFARSRTATCRSSSPGRPTRRASGWRRCLPATRRRSQRTGRGFAAIPTTTLRTIVADGVVVGNAVSWTGDEGRMVGYWIGKEHWGRGIASAALRPLPRRRSASAPARDRRRAQRGLAPRAREGRLPARGDGSSWTTGRSPARLPSCTSGSVRPCPAGPLLDELVELPVRHPEVGVAPAGVLADPVGLDAGCVQLGDRAVEIVDDQADRALHGAVFLVRRSHREDVAVRRREELCSDAVDGDRRQAEHVPEEGAHLHMSRCVTADEADPADLHVCSPLAVSAILTGEHMFV